MLSPRRINGYGWRPDLPDQRDRKIQVVRRDVPLPIAADLRGLMPPVYDQGDLGSCTANAGAAALQYLMLTEAFSDQSVPSRLFIYYNERVIEGDVDNDGGAQVRDACKVIASLGSVPESRWPYDVSKYADRPTEDVFKDALVEKNLEYSSVNQDLYSIKALVAGGLPVIFGFTVYESFESALVAQTGIVPMPTKNENIVGGHAVMIVGYDDDTQSFIVRNSWGVDWGQKGYFTMPYDYISNPDLSSDFWVLRVLKGGM